MRHAVSALVLFLVVTLLAAGLYAQSGRKRSDSTTSPTTKANSNSNTSTTESEDVNVVDGPAETIENDTLRVDTSLVMVPVSVMDRYGKYIPTLRRQDFKIFDQGVEQKIAYFATVDQPFTVALIIDTSNSTHFKMEEIQDAAIAFVNQLQPQDKVLVISFDDSIKVLSEATSDRDALMRAIRKAHTGGGTRLYDAVDNVIRKKLGESTGRKAVVLFTDGVDTASHSATYSSTIREAQEADGAIYPVAYDTSGDMGATNQLPMPGGHAGLKIGIPGWPGANGGKGGYPGSNTDIPEYRTAVEYLHRLAESSGGQYYRGDSLVDVTQAFADVAETLRRQYSIGYYPRPAGQAGQVRQIKVRVTQPDAVVKARQTYVYAQKKAGAPSQNHLQ
jgi:Ca-activated chloride channel homolog